MRGQEARAVACAVAVGVVAACASGCGRTYRFEPSALAEALRLRESELGLVGGAAPASGPSAVPATARAATPRGLVVREARRGEAVKLPPKGKLVLVTAASEHVATPSALALEGDALVDLHLDAAAGAGAGAGTRIALADLKEARFHRPARVPIVVGVVGVIVSFFGVVALTVYLNQL